MSKCFKIDEDAHWYIIDVDEKELFDDLLYKDEDCIDFVDKFGDKMLNMHISNYCFDNFREIED